MDKFAPPWALWLTCAGHGPCAHIDVCDLVVIQPLVEWQSGQRFAGFTFAQTRIFGTEPVTRVLTGVLLIKQKLVFFGIENNVMVVFAC